VWLILRDGWFSERDGRLTLRNGWLSEGDNLDDVCANDNKKDLKP
jgi:hypothetical protein